jgi:hypothetical protein
MWRQALNRLEENMNNMGTQSLKSNEVTKALLQAGTTSTQMQTLMRKSMDQYFKAINLPTRSELLELGEALRRIEDKLDLLLPAAEKPQIPRPSRTRRPAAEKAADSAPKAPAPVPAKVAAPEASAEPPNTPAAAAPATTPAKPAAAPAAKPQSTATKAARKKA